MKLYLISQCDNDDYDAYDHAVVVAENAQEAMRINPDEYVDKEWFDGKTVKWSCWALNIRHVSVECIGEAKDDMKKGVVLRGN